MYKILMVICAFWLLSCEKNVTIGLQEAQDVLVVDAEIENDKAPVVILTKSFSFFSRINPALLANSFIRNAEVYISNDSLTHRLKEYEVSFAPGFTGWYYSIDSASLSTAFLGELDHEYSLRIVYDGKEYLSSTRIPALATFPDSVYFKPAPMNPDTNKRAMFIKATDPPGLGNYVRYFTKRNSEPFYPGENSVFDDQVIDGVTYDIQLPKGVNKNDPPEDDDNFYFAGDTVTLKFCNIDRASYRFWNTWEFAFQSIGNPFSQPNTVIGNISNGALGVFCGYAAWYQTNIAP